MAALLFRSRLYEGIFNHLVASGKEPPLWICGEQARAVGRFGDIPVIVLSAGIQDWEEDPKLDNDHALKLKLQHGLAALSAQGIQKLVDKSRPLDSF
jgi:hypothetical protein